MDGGAALLRLDHPDEPRPGVKVLAHLLDDVSPPVFRREDLDGEVGGELDETHGDHFVREATCGDELQQKPEWAWTSPPFPPFLEIMGGLARLVTRHPRTTFIGAHVGGYPENLGWVSELLDPCANFYVDISDSIAELGRQPRTARRFFLRHADRILFGTDVGPDPEMSRVYYRFLETGDEYFNPDTGDGPRQGRWYIYGLELSQEVLEKVYLKNASRILELESWG